jgi:hypothetical protein
LLQTFVTLAISAMFLHEKVGWGTLLFALGVVAIVMLGRKACVAGNAPKNKFGGWIFPTSEWCRPVDMSYCAGAGAGSAGAGFASVAGAGAAAGAVVLGSAGAG